MFSSGSPKTSYVSLWLTTNLLCLLLAHQKTTVSPSDSPKPYVFFWLTNKPYVSFWLIKTTPMFPSGSAETFNCIPWLVIFKPASFEAKTVCVRTAERNVHPTKARLREVKQNRRVESSKSSLVLTWTGTAIFLIKGRSVIGQNMCSLFGSGES